MIDDYLGCSRVLKLNGFRFVIAAALKIGNDQ